MTMPWLKTLFFSFIFLALPINAHSQSCEEVLGSSFEKQATKLISDLSAKRKSLEGTVHKSIGTLSPKLQQELDQIFRLENHQDSLFPRQQKKLLRLIEQDPIASRLDNMSKSKLIRLAFTGHARPYMALLIARYMNEKENSQGSLTPNILFSIEMIVTFYLIEWTSRSLIRHRLKDLNEKEKIEILNALSNPSQLRHRNGINYNSPSGYTAFNSMFVSYFVARTDMLARMNINSINGQIFQ